VDEIVMWLRAELDVDEANAYEVHDRDCPSVLMTWTDWTTPKFVGRCDCGWPERVLAEVEAKRKLLDWLDDTWDRATDADFFGVDADHAYRLIALPYADRPGYREDWRP
jgi:hypothetical protein